MNILLANGLRVAGALQRETPGGVDCCPIMHLEDIETGRLHRISQSLGRGSKGCRLDPSGLAEISGALLASLDGDVDIVVLNRFGKADADGQGFRAVITRSMELGIPVLTAVRETYWPAWQDFTDGSANVLRPATNEMTEWAFAAVHASLDASQRA